MLTPRRRMASRSRGALALRPAADAHAWEVVAEGGAGCKVFGPFHDAADVLQALRDGAALLGIREAPSATDAPRASSLAR